MPVSGTVTLDGSPVEGAAVILEPVDGGRPASATTDASGGFSLKTIVGPHNVAIAKTKVTAADGTEVDQDQDAAGEDVEIQPAGEDESVNTEFLTPMKYASPMTSGLKVDVTADMAPLEFELAPDG